MEEFPEIRDQFLPAINKGYEIHLIPSRRPNKTDMVARFNVNGQSVDILIAFVESGDYGQYTGKINFIRGTTYQTGERHSVNDFSNDPSLIVSPQ